MTHTDLPKPNDDTLEVASALRHLNFGDYETRKKGMQAFVIQEKGTTLTDALSRLSPVDTLIHNAETMIMTHEGHPQLINMETQKTLQESAARSIDTCLDTLDGLQETDPLTPSFQWYTDCLHSCQDAIDPDIFETGNALNFLTGDINRYIKDLENNPMPREVTTKFEMLDNDNTDMTETKTKWEDLPENVRNTLKIRCTQMNDMVRAALQHCNDVRAGQLALRAKIQEAQAGELKSVAETCMNLAVLSVHMSTFGQEGPEIGDMHDVVDDESAIREGKADANRVAGSAIRLAALAQKLHTGKHTGILQHGYIDPADLQKEISTILQQANLECDIDFRRSTPEILVSGFSRLLGQLVSRPAEQSINQQLQAPGQSIDQTQGTVHRSITETLDQDLSE